MKPTTIRDVAKRAGVGLGTVSRVLNESPSVSEATRQKVWAAISELDFVPSSSARRLSSGRTLNIAVIVPFFTRPSFIERLRGIENSLVNTSYDLIIYNIETVHRRDVCMREIPRSERADGVIILSLPPCDEDIPFLKRSDVPIVLVDANHPSLSSLNRVIVDDVEGGRQATQHLIDLGHRRIGYISDFLDTPFNFTSSRCRFEGYLHALRSAGIEFRQEFCEQGDHDRIVAYRSAMKMLSLSEPPSAIFAASDTQAMGVLQAAKECNLHVPDELSVIGYDDIEVAEYLNLTTIRQLLFRSGQLGVEYLLCMIDQPATSPVCKVLPTELIFRGTTAKLR